MVNLGSALNRNLWSAGALRLSAIVFPMAIALFLLQNAIEMSMDWIATAIGIPSRLDKIKEAQSGFVWVSPLIVAPVLENTLCLLGIKLFTTPRNAGSWKIPALVAFIAVLVHALIYMEIRYFSIYVNFFVICCLIQNVENKAAGFWASVLLHALINFMVMMQLRSMGWA